MKFNQILLSIAFMISTTCVFSQGTGTSEDKALAYTRTINLRAQKIVAVLGISDSSKAHRVTNLIANQYRDLNDIHTARDEKMKKAKTQNAQKEVLEAQIKTIEGEADKKIEKLHAAYLSNLESELTAQQVVQVKDGMTYGVVPITYKGYLAMIPSLTEKQKDQIMTWLVEAREHAMDAESSDKKHWWFGKYKGRINNYLSAQGYDLKKEGDEWEKRRKAQEKSKL